MGEQDCVLVHDEPEGVRTLTLNRPAKRNAIDLELRVVLAEVLEASMADETVRAIVLTGTGGFCSGGDISTMRRQPSAETRPRAEAAQRVIRAIWNGRRPVIAAVEGPAFGAGAALAMACDRVVAASDAVFNTSFTGVGLAGDMGVFASLPARTGPAVARQLMMLPRRLDGAAARDLGLVDSLVDPGSAESAALADARTLAAGPPLALAAVKAMFASGPLDPAEVLNREVETQAMLFDTDDFAAGVVAFHERRKPTFTGR